MNPNKQDLLQKVPHDYDLIASSFSDTRNRPWPEFNLLADIAFSKKDQTPSSKFQILDLGCGNGRLYDFLSGYLKGKSKFLYTGLDNSQELLKQAQLLHKDISKFQYGSILDIPFSDNHFDQIWAIASFHHLPKEKQVEGAKEIYRVLKQDGLIIITTWQLFQKRYWKEILKAFLKNPFRIKNLFIPWRKGEEKLDRFYYSCTPRELKKTFEKAGFEIIDSFAANGNQKAKYWWQGRNLCLIAKK